MRPRLSLSLSAFIYLPHPLPLSSAFHPVGVRATTGNLLVAESSLLMREQECRLKAFSWFHPNVALTTITMLSRESRYRVSSFRGLNVSTRILIVLFAVVELFFKLAFIIRF